MATLAEVLALEVFNRARPVLVHGESQLSREVRWVHTSELVEAATLLRGGELLLTTGLGLAGRGPVAQGNYVAELARKGAAALALELGWSFEAVPEPLASAARAHDLPLIALTEIVPFVEVTEAVQTHLLATRAERLSLDRDVDQVLLEQLLRGERLEGLVTALSELVGCPVILETSASQIIAAAGLQGASARSALKRGEVSSASIEVLDSQWGWIHLVNGPGVSSALIDSALERAPSAISLSLLHDEPSVALQSRVRRDFLRTLVSGRLSREELAGRASMVNFATSSNAPVIGFAVGGYSSDDSALAVSGAEAAIADRGGGLVAEVDGAVLGLLEARRLQDSHALAEALLTTISETMRQRGSRARPRVAVGPAVPGLDLAGRSLRDAQATLGLAVTLNLDMHAVTAQGLAADRVLMQIVPDPLLGSLIDDQIGALLRHDASHRDKLTETLWVYLTHGSGKARTAELIHLRRQSLYKRLARIGELVGDIDDPERRLSLLIALRAHMLQSMAQSRPAIADTAITNRGRGRRSATKPGG